MIEEGLVNQPRPPPGLITSARNFLATLLALVATRAEIVATELEEERTRLANLLVWAACAAVFGLLTLVFLSLLIVAAFWDSHRIAALVAVTLAHIVLAIYCGLQLRRRMDQRPRLFATTLEELRKDQAGLQP